MWPYCANLSHMRGRPQGFRIFHLNYSGSRKGHLVLNDHLGGEDANKHLLQQRAQALNFLLNTWLGKVDQLLVWLVLLNPIVDGCLIPNLTLVSQPASGIYPSLNSIN